MPAWLAISIVLFGVLSLIVSGIWMRAGSVGWKERIRLELATEEAPALALAIAEWFNSESMVASQTLIVSAAGLACALGWKIKNDPLTGKKIAVQKME